MARFKMGSPDEPLRKKQGVKQQSPQEKIPEANVVERNVNQFLADVYGIGRSGLGAGNVAQALARESGAPEWLQTGLRYALPTVSQARQEYGAAQNLFERAGSALDFGAGKKVQEGLSNILPETLARSLVKGEPRPAEYFTQTKPEDAWIQGASRLGLSTLAGAATGGLAGAGYGALSHIGGLGGASVGSSLGQALGAPFGYSETGAELGGLAGGMAGAKYLPEKTRAIINRPSKELLPKLRTAEEEKLREMGRVYEGEITNINDLYDNSIKEIEEGYNQKRTGLVTQQEAELSGLKNDYKPRFDVLSKGYENEISQINNRYETEISNKVNEIENLNAAMSKYEAEIAKTKQGQNPLYEAARAEEMGAVGNPINVRNALNEARKSVGKAVAREDASVIAQLFEGLDADLRNNTMDVATSKLYAKRLNNAIYNSKSNTVKDILSPVRDSLNEFTESISSPEHAQEYGKARQATRSYKEMRMNKPIAKENARKDLANAKLKLAELKRKKAIELKKAQERFDKEQKRMNEEYRERAKEAQRKHKQEAEQLQFEEKRERENAIEKRKREVQQAEMNHQRMVEAQKENLKRVNELNNSIDPLASAGLGAFYGKQFGMKSLGAMFNLARKAFNIYNREKSIVNLAMEINPGLAAEYQAFIKNAGAMTDAQIIASLNAIGQNIKETIEEEVQKPVKSTRKIRIGSR